MSASAFKFITRPGCHLCDDARPLVMNLVSAAGGVVEEVNIETDDSLLERFVLRIPVVLTPDGGVLVEGLIDKKSLKRALRTSRKPG